MASKGPDALVESYLEQVRAAVAPLRSRQRRQVVDEISARIAGARLGLDDRSEVVVGELLDRLGPAASVAAAALEGAATRRRPGRRREGAALRWLLFGRLLFGVGWFVGVRLLWRSPAWSRLEKLLGTLVLPGGLLWAFALAPRQVAEAPGGVSLTGWSSWGLLALVLPLASAAVLASGRRRLYNIALDA